MIIVCSSCKACYLVPASTFAAGPRNVRCARCGIVWLADLPSKTTVLPWDDPPGTQPIERKEQTPIPPVSGESTTAPAALTPPESEVHLPAIAKKDWKPFLRKGGALVGGVLLLAGLIWLFVAGPLKGLSLHSSKPAATLALRDVTSERRFENGSMQLIVDGKIYNETAKALPLTPIEATAMGPDGKTIQSWKIAPPTSTLAGRESVGFHSAITTPEGSIAAVNLKFVAPNAAP